MQICKKYRSPAEKTFSRGVFYLRPQDLTRKFRVKPEKEEVHFMEAHFHLTWNLGISQIYGGFDE